MADDEGLLGVVRMLDDACKEAGFFYVVITQLNFCFEPDSVNWNRLVYTRFNADLLCQLNLEINMCCSIQLMMPCSILPHAN
jgi:hypothetical protein